MLQTIARFASATSGLLSGLFLAAYPFLTSDISRSEPPPSVDLVRVGSFVAGEGQHLVVREGRLRLDGESLAGLSVDGAILQQIHWGFVFLCFAVSLLSWQALRAQKPST